MQNVHCDSAIAGAGLPNQCMAKSTEAVILSQTGKGDSIVPRLSLR